LLISLTELREPSEAGPESFVVGVTPFMCKYLTFVTTIIIDENSLKINRLLAHFKDIFTLKKTVTNYEILKLKLV